MKKTKIICINEFNIIKFIKNNKLLLLLLFLFVLGVILSVVLYRKDFLSNKFSIWIYNCYFSTKINSFLLSLGKCFISLLLIVVLFFICGTSMMGIITVPILISALGFTIGSLVSHVYSVYGIKGVAYTAVILVPSALIFLSALFVTSRHTINFSFSLAKLTFSNSLSKNISQEFKGYCFKYISLFVFTFLSAFLDVILNNSFVKYFEFLL